MSPKIPTRPTSGEDISELRRSWKENWVCRITYSPSTITWATFWDESDKLEHSHKKLPRILQWKKNMLIFCPIGLKKTLVPSGGLAEGLPGCAPGHSHMLVCIQYRAKPPAELRLLSNRKSISVGFLWNSPPIVAGCCETRGGYFIIS